MPYPFGILALTLWLVGMLGVASCADNQKPSGGAMEPHAIITTKFGEMEIKFYPELAPKHVENFMTLARSGFYNGTLFHRVIPGFMIQGGDPNTKDPANKSQYGMGGPPGVRLKAEFNATPHTRGIVSMARSNHPDSAGSQFFIVVQDSPSLDRQYTAFGEVIRGMEVADQIVNAPRGANDLPNERIEMTVTIVEKEASGSR